MRTVMRAYYVKSSESKEREREREREREGGRDPSGFFSRCCKLYDDNIAVPTERFFLKFFAFGERAPAPARNARTERFLAVRNKVGIFN